MESEEVITFSRSNFFSSSFACFQGMRKTEELCDLSIKVQNVSLVAHRVVLAAGIPYFRSVFCNRTPEETAIALGDLEPAILESIINFAYSGTIDISTENAQSLLQASRIFLLDEVSDACVEFLSKRLLLNNVLEVYGFANNLNKSILMEKCIYFIQENFEEFTRTDDFGNLTGTAIKEIISADDLNVPNEEVVTDAVLKWVKYSSSERHVLLPDLLREVRMIYLPTDYLTERLSTEKLIRESLDCRNLIDEVKNYRLRKNEREGLNLKREPRKYSIQPGIYAICTNTYEHRLYQYGYVNNTWRHMTTKPNATIAKLRNDIFNAVAVNEKLYIFFRKTIETFHPKTLKWQQLGARHRDIHGASVVYHEKIIYCFGSYDVDFIGTVRRFDTQQNEWLNDESMKTARCDTAVASLEGWIYVTGGYREGTYLNTAEIYNPLTGEWKAVAPLLRPRRRHGCVSINEKIYVFGGSTCGGDLRTGEMYDPLVNTWNFVSSLESERRSLRLVCHNDEIYAIGGDLRLCKYTSAVEIYDPKSDKWRRGVNVPVECNIYAVSIPQPGN